MADMYEKALKNAEKLKKAQLTAVANNKVTLPKAKSTSSSTKNSKSGTKSTASGNNSTKKTLTKRKGTTNNKHKLSEGAKKIQQNSVSSAKKTLVEAAKSAKTFAKDQADWVARDIKSDLLPTKERNKVQEQIQKEKAAKYQSKGGFGNDKIGQFYTGLGTGILDSTAGIPYAIATGKKLSESKTMGGLPTKYSPTTDGAATARSVGTIAGDMASYAMGYGAAGKATAKAAGKILATNAGKKATAKAVASKAGQKIGKETTEKVLQSATKNLVADATVGTVMDYGQGRGTGLEGDELASYMGKSALLNLGIGGAMEAAPAVLKALSKTKLGKSIAEGAGRNVDNVAKATADTAPAAKAAETGNLAPENPLPDANKFGARTIADEQEEYLEGLAAQIKAAESKANPTVRKQTNRTTGKVQNANKNAAKTEAETLFDEYIKVAQMSPEDFTEYIGKGTETASDVAAAAAKETVSPKVGDLTPEAKARVYKAVEDRSGAKVVEEELPDGVDGFYQDGVIHVNANAANPQYTVLKHELTHHLQSSDMYDSFSEFIFNGCKNRGGT